MQAPDNPQTLNRYSYTGNNPVNNIDPSGHSFWKKVGSFFKKFGDLIFPGLGAAARGDVKSVGLQLLSLGTMSFGSNLLLQASGMFSMYSMAIPPIGGNAAESIGKALGYASIALGAVGAGVEVGKGVNAWLNDTGKFYQINHSNLSASKVISEAEMLKQYGQNTARIFVNGQGQDVLSALKMASDKSAEILFYNPTHGAIADFTESILGTITGRGSLSTRLGKLMTQLSMDLTGYSQGTIISSNAMLYAGFNGGAAPNTVFTPIAKAVGMGRINLAANLAKVTVSYGQGETKFLDAIRLTSSELNPFGYAQGAIGLVTGIGLKQHVSY